MGQPQKFKIYITTVGGTAYYIAQQAADGTWAVTTDFTVTPLPNLPKDWDKIEMKWARNVDYFGVFRSMIEKLTFADEGRAILRYLRNLYGIESNAKLRIDMRVDTQTAPGANNMWRFETIYNSEFDFSTFMDDEQLKLCTVGTLDGGLYALLTAFGDVQQNIPVWDTSDGGATYTTDGVYSEHQGISLQYNAHFESAASVSSPFEFVSVDNATSNFVQLPAMVNVNSTPYIGNDIVSNLLKVGTQNSYTNNTGDYPNFVVESYLIKPIQLFPTLVATINATLSQIIYHNPAAGEFLTIEFRISEIDSSHVKTTSWLLANFVFGDDGSGLYNLVTLPNPTFTSIAATPITFVADRVYIFEIVQINPPTYLFIYAGDMFFTQLSIDFSSDASTDLRFPPSPFIGFRPHTLLNKLVERLSSTTVDANGFAIVDPTNVYGGTSTYLSDASQTRANNYDTIPYQQLIVSGNTLRVIQGKPYITESLKGFFKNMFAVNGCGLGIEGGNIVVEPIAYFFDSGTEIFDFGSNVAKLQIMELLDYYGNTLKTGYGTQWSDFAQYVGNSTEYYGIDAYNIQQDYKLPIKKHRNDIDWTADIIAEQYKIEVARANQNSSDQSSPSSSNNNYIIEVTDINAGPRLFYDPAGTIHNEYFLPPYVYPTNQDTTPGTPDYIRGIVYPNTATNLGLTPLKCMLRKGALLHSILDTLDSTKITFQKQHWQMQNGNTTAEVSGIATNLEAGLLTEVADYSIADLPPALFRPILLKFETDIPVNLYTLMDTNPRGYMSFTWVGVVYSGFVWEISQRLGDNMATTVTLLALPATVIG